MKWDKLIFTYFQDNLTDKNIILDQTKILPLIAKRVLPGNKPVLCLDRLECQQQFENPDIQSIVVSKEQLIPNYLKNRANIVRFSKALLPFDISDNILNKIGQEDLFVLLDHKPGNEPVTESNLKTLLEQAQKLKQNIDLKRIANELEEVLQKEGLSEQNWLEVGAKWGRLQYLLAKQGQSLEPYVHFGHKLNTLLLKFYLSEDFAKLYYYQDLKLIYQVAGYIQARRHTRFALVCFDGMGFSEWLVLKEYLKERIQGLEFKEQSIFNLIPTTTSICRQALFCADFIRPYQENIDEAKAFWGQFKKFDCNFYKDKELREFTDENLTGIQAVGMICNIFDFTAHSQHSVRPEQGKGFYLEQARMYLENSNVGLVLDKLLKNGFYIYITSDHGVIPATGNKNVPPKYLQDEFARRGCLAKHPLTKESEQFIVCPIPYVPDRFLLLAEPGELFGHAGEKKLTHGGISMDESILPFIEVHN